MLSPARVLVRQVVCHMLVFSQNSKMLAMVSSGGDLTVHNFEKKTQVACKLCDKQMAGEVWYSFGRMHFLMGDTVLFLATSRGFVTVDPATGLVRARHPKFFEKYDATWACTTVAKVHRLTDASVFMGTNNGHFIITVHPTLSCQPCKKFVDTVPLLDAARFKGRIFRSSGGGEKVRAPDDLRLLCQLNAKDLLCTYGRDVLAVIAKDEKELKILGTALEFKHVSQCPISCSEDGKLVLVTNSFDWRGTELPIWLLETDTAAKHEIRLSHGTRRMGAISPDGTMMAFVTDGEVTEHYVEERAVHSVEVINVNRAPI